MKPYLINLIDSECLRGEGIMSCMVDCLSVEIFNGQDVLENRIISVCNQLAQIGNIKRKMTVKEFIRDV